MAVISAANLVYYLSGGAGNANPALSIGGARSTTLVGAGLNNLWDDITGAEAAAGETTYRCIFFRNEDVNAAGLIAPVVYIDVQSEALDVIAIGLDPAGKNAAAATPADELTAPAGVAFTTPVTLLTGLALAGAPYVQNDFTAIWIRRTTGAGAAAINPDTASIRVAGDTTP